MASAVLDYICRKHQRCGNDPPPCDLRCISKTLKLDHVPKAKKQDLGYDCDLRCEVPKKFPEYIGPNHYTLYDPPDDLYRNTMIESALMNLAYFFIGATVVSVLFYILAYKHYWPMNAHILLITMGSQIFIPMAILMQNPLDGAGIWTKWEERQKESLILKLAGVTCIWIGTLFLFLEAEYRVITLHSLLGILCVLACIVDVFTLFVSYFNNESVFSKFERFVCVPSFLFSTLSFILGILKPSLRKWFPHPQIPLFLVLFCIIYTTIVVFRPIRSCAAFLKTLRH